MTCWSVAVLTHLTSSIHKSRWCEATGENVDLVSHSVNRNFRDPKDSHWRVRTSK